MGWGRRWPERTPRPKIKKLSKEEKEKLLMSLDKSIKSSPILTALNFRVRSLRGRFYYEQVFPDSDFEVVGRVTPLVTPQDNLLLEVEFGHDKWKEIAKGKVRTITNAISGDKKGTFHGLGTLDKTIRIAKKNGLDKLEIIRKEKYSFYYPSEDEECGVQEVLFHYYGIPICIIAEPKEWYAYHRTPHIREIDDKWALFRIKPSQSNSIDSSILWLEKRKWKDW